MMNRRGINILLVEDNPGDARLIKEYTDNKYNIRHCEKLSDTAGIIKEDKIDIVILDLNLPDSRGEDTYFRIAELEADVAIIILTGLQDKELGSKIVKMGAQDYLIKSDINEIVLQKSVEYSFERYKLLKKIKINEQEFRNLIQSNFDGILVLDSDKKIKFINEAGCGIFQSTWQELKDTRFEFEFNLNIPMEINLHGNTENIRTVEIIAIKSFWYSKEAYILTLRDKTEWKRVENALKISLNEKDVLLREVHHRVKNNLQVISSLLKLQSASFENDKLNNFLSECQNRIYSMSLVHEDLYKSEHLESVDFPRYIEKLTSNIISFYGFAGRRIEFVKEMDPLFISIDKAIPLGLVINEIISNSCKYAFADSKEGTISVRLKKNINYVNIRLADNGKGMANNNCYSGEKTLGLRLIKMLIEDQLDGEIKCDSHDGVSYEIDLKIEG